ncbi:hypothetical protein Taro_008467 [Colocasia esculenta]|uniref:AB hydrolase-1 domain-containing protein n=1 Tax=Colocasia esculenta TaxID=4460 RepID=A0A843U3H7_COLES|nr:hypothetical protein [Colocasia esculenta]
MTRIATALLPLAVAILAVWAWRSLLQPPAPLVCGKPGGPPVVSPRVRLADGRHLAYRESGVPRTEARHRVVVLHGLGGSKDYSLNPSPVSTLAHTPPPDINPTAAILNSGSFCVCLQGLVEELGIYFVSFDRAGYGESDPNPGRTVKSEAMDVQELADQLGLGDRFYVVGVSMGGYPAWSCIKHIPHRLAGVALIVPAINFWWPSLPRNLSAAAYGRHHPADQRGFLVARHAPWLFYAYMTQKLVMPSAIGAGHSDILSRQDKEIMAKILANRSIDTSKPTQQGVHESIHRDVMVVFGDWGFDLMDLANPFPRNEGSVRIWQGGEDRMVDAEVQRYVAGRLPWVRYHECSDCGHLFLFMEEWSNAILRGLVLGEEPTMPSAGA